MNNNHNKCKKCQRSKKGDSNEKNIAITRLFDERNNLKKELYREKYRNRKIVLRYQEKINELKRHVKLMEDSRNQDCKEFVDELMSLYSCEINVRDIGDESIFHKVNLLAYLNTPD